jgi:large-conductance mechanosensitive channel
VVIRSFIKDIVDSGHRITGFIMADSFDFRNLARTNMGDSTIRVILIGSNFHRDLINLILIGFIIVYFIKADS